MNEKFMLFIGIFIFFCLLFFNSNLKYSRKLFAHESKNKLITEILHLGKEDAELQNNDEIFAVVNDITFDSSENIIIVDSRMKNIRKFNLDGKLLFEYSKVGSGPGEIDSPWLIANKNNRTYVFDVDNRKIITFINDFRFEKEVIVFNSLQDMVVSEKADFYVSGVITENTDLSKNPPIHIFDQKGRRLNTFGKEIKFNANNITNSLYRIMVFNYYAGRISLNIYKNKLLASPVFDYHTFVYNLDGQFLYRFKNPDFKYKLLNYSVSKRDVSYSMFETQSGPAFGLTDKYIIKSYQLSRKKGQLEYFVDIFDWYGNVIQSQVAINGRVMDVSLKGLLVTTSPYPFTQIWVYRINIDQL